MAPLLGLTLLVACAHSAVQMARAQDATLFNARIVVGDGPVIPNGYITVQGGKIVTVAPGRPPQISGTPIDAAGMTALPGFIDGHKHLNTSPQGEKEQMQDLIENGFTTVLSALGPADSNLELIQKIDSGQINGPRIIASGRVDLRGTPDEARAAIRAMAAKGIKFTGEMPVTPEPGPTPQELAVLRAAVDEGRKDGVAILVHAVSTPAMVAVSEAGVHHEVHLPNKDFMGYDDAARIAASGTSVLDTVSFGAPIIDVFEQDDEPRFRTGLLWPESIAGANRDEQGRATGTEAAYSMMNARRIWDATHGRGLGYGSDQNYPVRDVLEHELKSLIVMLSVPDVVRVLTINTAAFMNMQNEIGTLEPLKRADIVLVRGNPSEDFNDLLKTVMVLKDGKVVVDKRTREPKGATDGSDARNASRAGHIMGAAASRSDPLVGTLTASVARSDQMPVVQCEDLRKTRLAHMRVAGARDIAVNSLPIPASPAGDLRAHTVELPAHCLVAADLGRTQGAAIRLSARLPHDDWNGSFVFVGDGGPIPSEVIDRALVAGYAVVSAESSSHGASQTAQPSSARPNAAAHASAAFVKALIRAYYGGTPRYSYWISTTASLGSQALEEVHVHPQDFDGVALAGVAGTQADATASGSPLDLSAFASRGGKLIEYDEGGDQAAAESGVSHYERQVAQSGGIARTRSFYRLFLMPLDQNRDRYRADWLTVLDEWVQRARAPDRVLLDHIPPANAKLSSPASPVAEPQYGVLTVCPYPEVARLQGGRGETPVDWLCLPGS